MQTKIIFFLLLLPISFSGWSQVNKIDLYSDAEYSANIRLRQNQGDGDEITLPILMNWDKKKNVIQVEFLSNNSDNYIYLFPKVEFFRDIRKKEPKIWFSKKIKKDSPEATVYKYQSNLNNVAISDEITKVNYYALKDPNANMQFKFDVLDPSVNNCFVLFRVFIASREFEKRRFLFIPLQPKRDRKIQYMSEITFEITLHDVCASAELLKIINDLKDETEVMHNKAKEISAEFSGLSNLPCLKISDLSNKQQIGKEKTINFINDERYKQYNDCDNLKEVIADYNAAIEIHDNAAGNFNAILKRRKQDCTEVLPLLKTIDCRSIEAANNKLMALYFKIEQSELTDLSSFQSEYDQITKGVTNNEKCSSFEAYKIWRSGIEKILKK